MNQDNSRLERQAFDQMHSLDLLHSNGILTDPLRIILAAPTSIPARRANTIQVMKMAQALVLQGHTVHLLSPIGETLSPSNQPSWKTLAEHYGLRTQFPVTWLPARSRLRRYDYSLSALLWAKRWGCDLYYTRLPQSAALASLINMPTIFEVHDLPKGRSGTIIFRLFLQGRGARRLVVITQALANDISRDLGAPPAGDPANGGFTIIAPDGVDLERYNNIPSTYEARRFLQETDRINFTLEERLFTVGYTGHLYPGRGVDLILDLASRLPEIQFLLVGGEVNEIERLKQVALDRALSNLFLVGFVPNTELPWYQAACDVLLMPYSTKVSASSGGDISAYLSPMKLFEYMASGRAILTSDLKPLREVLNPQNSMIAPPNNIEAWIKALVILQSEPEQRMQIARQARKDVMQYTWEKRATRILQGLQLGK